jgi:hypothetical protein
MGTAVSELLGGILGREPKSIADALALGPWTGESDVTPASLGR